MLILELILFIVECDYFGISDRDEKNCFFFDHMFFGVSDILMFNLSIMLGFKTYAVFESIYEFAVKGNLPSKQKKKRNKFIVKLIWIISITNFVLFCFMNIYWTYIGRNIYYLRIFNFGNRLAQIVLTALNALLFISAHRIISKTLTHTIVDKSCKSLLFSQKIIMYFAVTYLLLSLTLFWELFTQGYTDIWALLNYILANILYTTTQYLLVAMLFKIKMNFRLQTSVYDGFIAIVAVDPQGREVFRLRMK